MAISLDSISSGKSLKAPRIVVMGTEKVGKSTFASEAESPIFIPIKGEEGIDDLDAAKFPTCSTLSEVIECMGILYNDKHKYKTVVIDSVSTLEVLVWDEVCRVNGADSIEKVNGGYGKGYIEALKPWREVMECMDLLRNDKNMASIVIGHVIVKTFNDPTADPYDTYLIDLNMKAANALYRWSDAILFINQKAIVRKTDESFGKTKRRAVGDDSHYLYTKKRPSHPGGGRGVFGQLPYELPLSWKSFQEAVTIANDKRKEK